MMVSGFATPEGHGFDDDEAAWEQLHHEQYRWGLVGSPGDSPPWGGWTPDRGWGDESPVRFASRATQTESVVLAASPVVDTPEQRLVVRRAPEPRLSLDEAMRVEVWGPEAAARFASLVASMAPLEGSLFTAPW